MEANSFYILQNVKYILPCPLGQRQGRVRFWLPTSKPDFGLANR